MHFWLLTRLPYITISKIYWTAKNFYRSKNWKSAKLKQKCMGGTYTLFRARWVTFFLVNRVEHQKLNQTTPYGAVWLSFWCSTRPSADGGHKIVLITSWSLYIFAIAEKSIKQAFPIFKKFLWIYSMTFSVLGDVVFKLFSAIIENIKWSWCKRHYLVTAICRRPSWTPETQPNGAVRRRLVEFLVFNSIYLKKWSG